MTESLPKLLDRAGLQAELGVKRATAEAIMRAVPTIRIGRRVFVRRTDVEKHLEEAAA